MVTLVMQDEIVKLTPAEYELAVKDILDGSGFGLESFESKHLESVDGNDGAYIIDVTVRFRALGADFLVLVECKHIARRIEGNEVQVLHAKMTSTGAQKGMLFSISGSQKGALEYATAHKIALVQMMNGESIWFTRSKDGESGPPPWLNLPKFVGWWQRGSRLSVLSPDYGKYTRMALGIDDDSVSALD